MEENMITSIKICNAGTFNDKGAKIDNLKKLISFMVQMVVEKLLLVVF